MTPQYLDRSIDLGILEPDADGMHPASDVHLVRLMSAFEQTGIDLEDVGRGMAEGDLSFPLGPLHARGRRGAEDLRRAGGGAGPQRPTSSAA